MICPFYPYSSIHKKVQVGNDQEMAQSERNSHSINPRGGKNKYLKNNKTSIDQELVQSELRTQSPQNSSR